MNLLRPAQFGDSQLGSCGAGILPAAGFQPARPPEKAAAAKIGRPTSAPMESGTFVAGMVTVLGEPQ
jgi:hypothetical protein